LIQTLKVEAFPVILYGSAYWNGLVDWMRNMLVSRYIDHEDLDIFRIVDTPRDAAKVVTEGMKKHWWRPMDEALAEASGDAGQHRKTPLAGAKAERTGEGTR